MSCLQVNISIKSYHLKPTVSLCCSLGVLFSPLLVQHKYHNRQVVSTKKGSQEDIKGSVIV